MRRVNRVRVRGIVVGASCLVVSAAVAGIVYAQGARSAGKLVSWPTYGGASTSANVAPPAGLTAATARYARVTWSRTLDGTVFAGPVLGSLQTGQRLVVVGTEAGTLYALDARTGAIVWSRRITQPVAACGGSYGITSTPAIDEQTGVVYAIGASGRLTAVDLADGKVRWQLPLVSRTTVEHVWSGVRIVSGSAYIAVASYCDEPDASDHPADGYLLRVNLASRRVTARFDVVPGANNLGGIWGWGGVSVDPKSGALFTSTGNAVVYRAGNVIEDSGHAERVLQLTPALKVVDSTAPPSLAPDNRGDEDYGSTPLLFQPAGCQPLVAANSKNGHTYVWRRGDLHGRPLADFDIGPTNPDDPFLGQPTYLPSLRLLIVTQTVFAAGSSAATRGVSAYSVGADCKTFSHKWDLNIGGGHQAPAIAIGPVVVASAPASNGIALVDARSGVIVDMLDTKQPVYAPIATDGASIYAATVGGTVSRIASPAD